MLAAATILAQRGQQRECEALLDSTRELYKDYSADLRRGGIVMSEVPGWQDQQIASAESVDVHASSHNVDQLIGIDVVNRHGDSLGSVYDMIIDPANGKVAYLMIVRGGIFGFDEKVVPVPWHDFGITIGSHLLVLNASKVNMDAAPQTSKHQYSIGDQFRKESPAVDEYWLIHLSK